MGEHREEVVRADLALEASAGRSRRSWTRTDHAFLAGFIDAPWYGNGSDRVPQPPACRYLFTSAGGRLRPVSPRPQSSRSSFWTERTDFAFVQRDAFPYRLYSPRSMVASPSQNRLWADTYPALRTPAGPAPRPHGHSLAILFRFFFDPLRTRPGTGQVEWRGLGAGRDRGMYQIERAAEAATGPVGQGLPLERSTDASTKTTLPGATKFLSVRRAGRERSRRSSHASSRIARPCRRSGNAAFTRPIVSRALRARLGRFRNRSGVAAAYGALAATSGRRRPFSKRPAFPVRRWWDW